MEYSPINEVCFEPHPLVSGERTWFFGSIILKDVPSIGHKYEVTDKDNNIHHFDTDEEINKWLVSEYPGCFIQEG